MYHILHISILLSTHYSMITFGIQTFLLVECASEFFHLIKLRLLTQANSEVARSSSGIGLSISKELTKHGVNVVGLARRKDKLKELEAEISSNEELYKGKFYHKKCDIANVAQIKETLEWVVENIDIPHILVNNAAVLCLTPIPNVTEEEYNASFNTNVKGAVMCTIEVMKIMVQNNIAGHVVNISSIAGQHIFVTEKNTLDIALYTGTKYAVTALSECLRREKYTRDNSIKVSTIYPGAVESEMSLDKPALKLEFTEKSMLPAVDVAKAVITVLNTSPNCLISELTVIPIHQMYSQ